MMDLSVVAWMFAAAFGASALGGALGMASGIFIVPILTTFGHLDIHAAIVVSIVSVIACSCGGAAPFLLSGTTNIRLAVVLEVATTLGALSGLLLIGLLSVSLLYFLFAAVLFVSACQMLRRRSEDSTDEDDSTSRESRDSSSVALELFRFKARQNHFLSRSTTAVGTRSHVRRRTTVLTAGYRQWCPQNPRDGYRFTAADQSVFRHFQLHDWSDCGG